MAVFMHVKVLKSNVLFSLQDFQPALLVVANSPAAWSLALLSPVGLYLSSITKIALLCWATFIIYLSKK